jgi:hypothetical protein
MIFDQDGSEFDDTSMLDSSDKIIVDIGYLKDID